MPDLTPEKLAELRRLLDAATPGPREADSGEISQHWSRPEPWLYAEVAKRRIFTAAGERVEHGEQDVLDFSGGAA